MTKKKPPVNPNAPWKRPAPAVGEHEESDFSDDDIAAITQEDLRQRSQALSDAQETWEEVAHLANPKMPCPECYGAGVVHGGTLGDICVRCMGARVIEQPGAQTVNQPPFAELRAAITAYGDALADRQLPPGRRKGLALPAPETVPGLQDIINLREVGLDRARQLQGAPGLVDEKLLRAPEKAKGLSGDGDIGEYTDAELDGMESRK